MGRGRRKRKSLNLTSPSNLNLFCSENVCCFRIPVDWKRVTERGKSKNSTKVEVNERRKCSSRV